MKANPHSLPPNHSSRECAFTMIDLLVVVAVIALLLTLRLSAMTGARDQTLHAQCAGNIHQLALTSILIANDNADKFPGNVASNWEWDMSWNVGNLITNYMPLQSLYCPSSGFNYDDNNRLWGYEVGAIHVISYAQTFVGTGDEFPTNYNVTWTPLHIPTASQRVLFADAVISAPGQNSPALISSYNWTDIVGAYPKHHRTSHMDGPLPAGGNVAMLDGHVEWRNFSLMVPRGNVASTPVFWW